MYLNIDFIWHLSYFEIYPTKPPTLNPFFMLGDLFPSTACHVQV